MNLFSVIGEFIKPFLLEHSRTLIPGQPRDVMDIYIEKMIANKDDTRSSFHEGKSPKLLSVEFYRF